MRGYVAPELIITAPSTSASYAMNDYNIEELSCDILSLGIILCKMLMGIDSHPFEIFKISDVPIGFYKKYKLIHEGKHDTWWKYFDNNIPYEYYHDNDLKRLFIAMFDSPPDTRIKLNEIKKQHWYKTMHKRHDEQYFVGEMWKMRQRNQIFMCVQ